MMTSLPIHKRQFHAFLSHAHADKAVVDQLHHWLTQESGISIWYDAQNLPPGTQIGTYLSEAITLCRCMIVVLSKSSVGSGWVEEEMNAAVGQRTSFKKFRIIPVRIDECEVPEFLRTTKWIDAQPSKSSISSYDDLLAGLYYDEVDSDFEKVKDIYISRSWREDESALADHICRLLAKTGFRMIGDAPDQPSWDEKRVASVISSCGGLVAILPDRGQGRTSKYILNEIQMAEATRLPCLTVAMPSIDLPQSLATTALRMAADQITNGGDAATTLMRVMADFAEGWKQPAWPQFLFFSTNFDDVNKLRNQLIKQTIQRVTAMPCIMGEDIRDAQIQKYIVERVSRASVVIADISEDNLNTCVESGIALGAKRPLHLVAREPRRKPPFMFRDQQVWYYADDVQLLGIIHKLVFPYRRRVLNWELQKT